VVSISLLGAILQIAALGPEVWKERNHPEEPVLQPCELGKATTITHTFAELPGDVALELARFFDTTPAMSDKGGLFNSTDVVDGNVPPRRFLRAYQRGDYWVIWYERGGGLASGPRTIALRRSSEQGSQAIRFDVAPGTSFTADLCAATKATLAGVRSSFP
jgi:hypothetical protein